MHVEMLRKTSLHIQPYDLLQAILLLQNVCVRIMTGRVLSLSHITSPIVVIICRHANHTIILVNQSDEGFAATVTSISSSIYNYLLGSFVCCQSRAVDRKPV